jgi:hypothetical protein
LIEIYQQVIEVHEEGVKNEPDVGNWFRRFSDDRTNVQLGKRTGSNEEVESVQDRVNGLAT